jgi:hypothetical protein
LTPTNAVHDPAADVEMKADFELKFDMEQLVQPIQINDSTESQASLKIVKVEHAPAIKTQQKNNGNLKV